MLRLSGAPDEMNQTECFSKSVLHVAAIPGIFRRSGFGSFGALWAFRSLHGASFWSLPGAFQGLLENVRSHLRWRTKSLDIHGFAFVPGSALLPITRPLATPNLKYTI